MHPFLSFLGFILPKTDQKRMIYVIFKKNLESEQVRRRHIFLKIVKKTVFNQFFELDDERNGFRKGETSFIQQIYLKDWLSKFLLHDKDMDVDRPD